MLSIVIPVFNQQQMTADCLAAVRQHTQDYEVILVDNASVPPIEKPYMGFVPVTLLRNETNLGFPKAVNQGIAAATSDIIVLLNNDVIVTPGWSDKLLAALNEYSIVGPVTNYCGGMQSVQLDTYENEQELAERAEEWAEHWQDATEEVNFVIGFCMAFPKSLWQELGPFDETLWPCSGEEVDFCFRARQAGHRIGIVKGCYVHHEGSQTFKAMQDAGTLDYKTVCDASHKHVSAKWGGDYWRRQSVSAIPAAEGKCLNLGCGVKRSHVPGAINIDNRPEVQPDLVCDITKGLPFADNSVDTVYAFDFIEHLERLDVMRLMDEVYRVLKPGGTFYHRTPSDEGRGAWQDPTHRSAWNINTWRFYFVDQDYRELYGTTAHFSIIDLRDEWTDEENRILHTHCKYEAVK